MKKKLTARDGISEETRGRLCVSIHVPFFNCTHRVVVVVVGAEEVEF
jgi:hypothetical protein